MQSAPNYFEIADGSPGDPEALANVADVRRELEAVETLRAHVVNRNAELRSKANATLAKLDADSAARARDLADGGSPPSRNPKADQARLDAEELLAACDLREYSDGPEDLPAIDARLASLRAQLTALEQVATDRRLERLVLDVQDLAPRFCAMVAELMATRDGYSTGAALAYPADLDLAPLVAFVRELELRRGLTTGGGRHTRTAEDDDRLRIALYRERVGGGRE